MSVDRFFALRPSTQAKINEAMNSNAADSPYASDNDSNNPYDALRDDEEDKVPTDDDAEDILTDTDKKESEEDSTSNQSARPSDPSESDYKSANDTMSLAGKKPTHHMEHTDQNVSKDLSQASPEAYATPVSKHPAKLDHPLETESSRSESPDSKPRAKTNPIGNTARSHTDTNSGNSEMQDASRRLFDNRKPPAQMTVEEISPSVLDDLLYEARQHDTTLLATTGNPTRAPTQPGPNMATTHGNNANEPVPTLQHGFRPIPIPLQGGRGRGGRAPQRNPNQPRSGIQHPVAANQRMQANQSMDIENPAPVAPEQAPPEPDFSFTRPTYVAPTPPTPARKQFFRCTWRVDIPNNTPPEEGLRDAILEIWSVLKEADRCLIIYPWHQSAHGRYKALSDMTKFPKKKETLIRYFKDAYFHPHAGPMYIRVYLGCDLTMEDLGKQTSGFFNSPKNRLRVGF
jgi:hypothetical protein